MGQPTDEGEGAAPGAADQHHSTEVKSKMASDTNTTDAIVNKRTDEGVEHDFTATDEGTGNIADPLRMPTQDGHEPPLPLHTPIELITAQMIATMLADKGLDKSTAQALMALSQIRNISSLVEHDRTVTNSLIHLFAETGVAISQFRYASPSERAEVRIPFQPGGTYSLSDLQLGVLLLHKRMKGLLGDVDNTGKELSAAQATVTRLEAKLKQLSDENTALKNRPPPPQVAGAAIVLRRSFIKDNVETTVYLACDPDDNTYSSTRELAEALRFDTLELAVKSHIDACEEGTVIRIGHYAPAQLLYQELAMTTLPPNFAKDYVIAKGTAIAAAKAKAKAVLKAKTKK